MPREFSDDVHHGVPGWDEYYLKQCRHIAKRSKDRDTKLGCMIVALDNTPLVQGYNSFPRGINDNVPARFERPEKYSWMEHAERNAIYNAARKGIALDGAKAYLGLCPCMDCARALAQAGIVEVIIDRAMDEERASKDDKWVASQARSMELFSERNIKVRRVTIG